MEPHFSRRSLFKLGAVAGVAASAPAVVFPSPAAAAGPIVKPLPPEFFTVLGTNAEMRWSAMRGQGHLVPIDRFFVRNHTSTPIIDAATWTLEVTGAGLRGGPVTFTYDQLRALPAHTVVEKVECAGNGRSYFTSQQGQPVSGTAWHLGAVGVARWRGVRLSTVLRRAGISPDAVDVMPVGLDADYVTGGVNLGPVRRPIPVRKAQDDVLLAYEMNGEPLPPDHGHPVRVIVPGWIGIASIKWVGRIEVSDRPLTSPWNTQFYRLFGENYPAEGLPFDEQVVKSAFELDENAALPVGRRTRLTGRSWSAQGPIRKVEVSTDAGATWHRAHPFGGDRSWQRWQYDWRPAVAGPAELRARATDVHGNTQPETSVHNTLGYLFDAVVRHPVQVA